MQSSSHLATVGAVVQIVRGVDGSHDLFQVGIVQVPGGDVPVSVEDAVILRKEAEQGMNILFKTFGWLPNR